MTHLNAIDKTPPTKKEVTWMYIKDINVLDDYINHWKECLNYTQDSTFMTPSWIEQWVKTFWQNQWSLHLYIALDNNKCVLFAPFYIKKDSTFPYLRTFSLLGQGEDSIFEIVSEYQDILLHPDYSHLTQSLTTKLQKLNFDQINITSVLENADILQLFASTQGVQINNSGIRYSYSPSINHPPILSKNTKSKLNKCKNKLDAINAEYIWVQESKYDKYWQLMKEFHQNRWQALNKKGAFHHTLFSDFHNTFRLKNTHSIRISAILVNNVPIAINYYIYSNHNLYFYQSGWDEVKYAKASPGFALHMWSMNNLDYHLYDFMRGSAHTSYKNKLGCNHNINMYNIVLIKNKFKLLLVKLRGILKQ